MLISTDQVELYAIELILLIPLIHTSDDDENLFSKLVGIYLGHDRRVKNRIIEFHPITWYGLTWTLVQGKRKGQRVIGPSASTGLGRKLVSPTLFILPKLVPVKYEQIIQLISRTLTYPNVNWFPVSFGQYFGIVRFLISAVVRSST